MYTYSYMCKYVIKCDLCVQLEVSYYDSGEPGIKSVVAIRDECAC
jgi:hypothetical protein